MKNLKIALMVMAISSNLKTESLFTIYSDGIKTSEERAKLTAYYAMLKTECEDQILKDGKSSNELIARCAHLVQLFEHSFRTLESHYKTSK